MPNPYSPDDSNRNERRDDRRDPPRDMRDPRAQPPGPDPRAELIPEGRYPVIAVSFSFGVGKQAEQVGVACQFQEGPGKGQIRPWRGSFSDNAIEFTLRGLRALGWQGDDLRKIDGILPKNGGKVAIATLEHEEYEGKWREKIAWLNDDGVAFSKPLEGPDFEKFAARMRNVIPKVEGRGGGSAQSLGGGGYGQGGSYQGGGGHGGGQGRDDRRDEPPPPTDRDEPWDRRSRGGNGGRGGPADGRPF
jgi:hypothetical protein